MLEILTFSETTTDYSVMNTFENWLNDQEKRGYTFLQIVSDNFKKGLKDQGYYNYRAEVLFRKTE